VEVELETDRRRGGVLEGVGHPDVHRGGVLTPVIIQDDAERAQRQRRRGRAVAREEGSRDGGGEWRLRVGVFGDAEGAAGAAAAVLFVVWDGALRLLQGEGVVGKNSNCVLLWFN
jgi:hypothetical protein